MQLVVGLVALLRSVQHAADDYAMSYFTVHVEHLYNVEADTAEQAYDLVANSLQAQAPDSTHMYVTDEMGEEVEVAD